MRENRFVIADLRGKGGRIRTVAVPVCAKWDLTASRIEEGRLFRSVKEGGKKIGRVWVTGLYGQSSSS